MKTKLLKIKAIFGMVAILMIMFFSCCKHAVKETIDGGIKSAKQEIKSIESLKNDITYIAENHDTIAKNVQFIVALPTKTITSEKKKEALDSFLLRHPKFFSDYPRYKGIQRQIDSLTK